MSHVVYVIGYPGSGKTTLVRAALKLLDREVFIPARAPVPHEQYGDIWHLGVDRPPFGGTDALSMSIQPKAIAMLEELTIRGDCATLVGEGDRLANVAYFAAVRNNNHPLSVVYLEIDPALARARVHDRATAFGGPAQTFAWWKGRITKTNNLVNARPVIRLDATLPVTANATYLHSLITNPNG